MYIQQIFYANITLSFILKNQKLFTNRVGINRTELDFA